MTDTIPDIKIPADLLPTDGRFGSGPSLVRPEALQALADTGAGFLGTSHRRPNVKNVVARLQDGLSSLFGLPDDWEIVLGNGGSTLLWDALTFCTIDQRSQHLVFGEFSSKFAIAAGAAPHIGEPEVINADVGSHAVAVASDVDFYAVTHNETSTGVMMPITRPAGTSAETGLVAVDATSAAGGLRWDPAEADIYYFAPQKAFGSDGGLFLAACSPAAIARIERITSSDRWIPAGLDLGIAAANSRKNQTYNTPALATIFLAVHQVEWMNENGGIEFAAGRSEQSAATVYGWADAHELATPFVTDPAMRSTVVATIDFDDSVSADTVAAVLRANGVIDTESYRKLGRNQLRIAMFPAIEPSNIAALTTCIDHVLGAL